jgi:lipopolysaccharide export system permease protein
MIIDRYIMREIIKPTIAVCSILVFIFGCYMATHFLVDALSGQLPGTTVIILILLRIAIALEVLLPTTLYLCVVVALGRLYKDSEMTALFACGVSMGRIIRPVLYTAVATAVVVASLSLLIRPWAYQQYYRIKANAEANFDLTRMNDGTFYDTKNGMRVIYAEAVDHQQDEVERVFIRTERDDDLQVIFAKQAKQIVDRASGKQIMVFSDGHLYEFSRTGNDGRVIQFEQSAMPLEPEAYLDQKYRVKAEPTGALARSEKRKDIAEFQWRLSTPLAAILLALIGVPLSRSSPRHGKYAKITTAVVIFAVYYNLSALTKKWVERGILDATPGIWWIQMLLAGLLLVLLWQPSRVLRRRGK